MAKPEFESTSSSSVSSSSSSSYSGSSLSESDSSSSDNEVPAVNKLLAKQIATSMKVKAANKKQSKKKGDDSSSESSSDSDDDYITSSSSSSDDSEQEKKSTAVSIKVEHDEKAAPHALVPETVEQGKVKSEDGQSEREHISKEDDSASTPIAAIAALDQISIVTEFQQNDDTVSQSSTRPILQEDVDKAQSEQFFGGNESIQTEPEEKKLGGAENEFNQPEQEVGVLHDGQNNPNQQTVEVDEHLDAEKSSKQPEPEEGELPDEPETITENIVEKPVLAEVELPAEAPHNDDTQDGEPETKKIKMESVVTVVSRPTDAIKEPSNISKSKEVSRRRSSRDRSRSAERRLRRRSRDREERSRRQRSQSDSRDRRRRRSRTRSRSNDRGYRGRGKSQDRRRPKSPPRRKDDEPKEETNSNDKITERQRRTVDLLTSRTGGAYIPPAKLRMMQAEITDKASAAYQRIAWEALKKSIHGYINKVNVDNIGIITRELLKENIVRGRGLLCRSIIQAQAASPTFTHVYSALVAIINSKFPNIGELLLKRLVIQFKRAFRRNDKAICLSASRFIAHLVNQRVSHEILALEILTLLVETPTDDSVEVAIAFLKECGMKLTEVTSKGIGAIFEMLKNILHEGKLDKRVQYMIEVVFQVRKDGFKDHQSVIEALELVEEDDQFTHLLMLDEATTTEDNLNAFKFDDKYETNEDKYKGLSREILGSDASDSDENCSGSGSDDSDSEEDEEEKAKAEAIIDNTETNLVALRRTIYLTINSSLDYEECAHKLMKMQLKPGQEIELCHMFLDCCAEQRTYEKFYGLLAQRFCSINKTYIEPFEEIFKDTYQTTHRLDTNRLRNVSKFFAHLLFTDAIGWDVLDCIQLNEDDTTSSSRIFIKILFQELAEYMGLGKLNQKLKDDVLVESLAGLFPKDNPRNSRFSINFFTSIGLGGLTDDLRHFLKNAPKNVPAINSELLLERIEVTSSSSSSSSVSSSSSSSSESSSESSSSEEEKEKRKKRKKVAMKKKVVEKSKKKKKNKSKKKNETSSSSSDSSESGSSSSSESSSSSSEDDKKNKKKKRNSNKVQVSKKKQKKEKSIEPAIEEDGRRGKDKSTKRDAIEEKLTNSRSENGREQERNGREKNYREERNDRDKNGPDRSDRGRSDRERNDRERSDRERSDRERNDRERGDRKDSRKERSPNRDRRHRDNYNQSAKSTAKGKSHNGSKEGGQGSL